MLRMRAPDGLKRNRLEVVPSRRDLHRRRHREGDGGREDEAAAQPPQPSGKKYSLKNTDIREY